MSSPQPDDAARTKLTLEEKRELVRKELLARARGAAGVRAPLVRGARTGSFPASFAQERLWFLDRLQPGSALYNLPGALRLKGSLDREALEAAISEVVAGEEVLRTVLREERGAAVQVILPAAPLQLPVRTVRDESEARALLEDEARQGFDLETGPLARFALLALGPQDHVLAVNLHHIIGDAASSQRLLQAICARYDARQGGPPPPADPPDRPQYGDFARWQREHLTSSVVQAQLDYWRQQLAGAPATLALPTDFARPAIQRDAGARLDFGALPGDLSARLRDGSARLGATAFMAAAAAFGALLARYSGQTDLPVGTSVAGRNRPQTQQMLGLFINTTVLRLDAAGDPTFAELVQRTRATSLSAFNHAEVPFERLVEALRPPRDLSRTPLFQVMFELIRQPSAGLTMRGLQVEPWLRHSGTSKFDLSFNLLDLGNRFALVAEYSTDLYAAQTIERLCRHYCVLLEAALAAPQTRLSALPLLTADDRARLLSEWNDSATEVPHHVPFARLFEETVRRRREAVAARCGDEEISYGALNARANRWARGLRGLGVDVDQVVAILAPRSLSFLSAMLATFKAGGGYLPLDPAHPPKRWRQLLEQSNARVLVVSDALFGPASAALAGWGAGAPRLVRFGDLPSGGAAEDLPISALPESLGYVLFTSGSTGVPKGVMIPQRGMVNHLFAEIREMEIGEGDVIAQTASQCFDISVWQFLVALVVGAQTEIVPDDVVRQPAELMELIERRRVSILEPVPALLRALLDEALSRGAARPSLRSLRWVMPTGEALPPALCRDWFAAYPQIPLINAYGPAECSDDVSHHVVRSAPDWANAPIGRPAANLRLYVLDERLQLVPPGVVGEICVGGIGVGRGYLEQPAMTADRFRPDPFAATPGARLYRTGDLGRHLPDGTIEFQGRVDFQVKLRGHRIELGEVEATLARQRGVREAVAVVRPAQGEPALVAYYAAEPEVTPETVRAQLKEALPAYMVPQRVVRLDRLPLSANGKVDRNALPPPPDAGAEAEGDFVPPRTAAEALLAGIWASVLGVDRVGRHDDFFTLGGHSLLAMQVLARVKEALGSAPPIRRFFEGSTLAQLAAALTPEADRLAPPQLLPRTGQEQDEAPLSFAQESLWFFDQINPDGDAYHFPMVLEVSGALQVDALERALGALVERHEAMRTTFHAGPDGPRQRIHPPWWVTLPVVEIADGAALAEALGPRTRRPFDLSQLPLARFELLRLGPERHVLSVMMHHIVTDAVSSGLWLSELRALYAAFSAGQPPALPKPSLQPADHAVWQRRWLAGEVKETLLGWWRQQLEGAPPTLELPTDRPRPAELTFRGKRTAARALDPALGAKVVALCREKGVTPFMLFEAAFHVLLSRFSGQRDLCVGTPTTGRDHPELEGVFGYFVNVLVLRLRLEDNPTFAALLARARGMALSAFAHADLPFEALVEALRPRRELSRTPLFQVMFAYQEGNPSGALPGLQLRPLPPDEGVAKYDLTLEVTALADATTLAFEYSTDLYDEVTVERMLDAYQVLLEALVGAPETRVLDAGVLSPVEAGWVKDGLAPVPPEGTAPAPGQTLLSLVADACRRFPERIALEGTDQALTYAQLWQRTQALAGELCRRGVRREEKVAVCAEKGPDAVVALLGVIAAGGAYVPLDPALPLERLRFMVEDAGARFAVVEPRTAHLALGATPVPCSGGDGPFAPLPEVWPEQLAYVIYTSGSTGRPKGVEVPHAAAANFVRFTLREYEVGPGDRLLQFNNLSFDISVEDVFTALCGGATLCFATAEELTPGAALAETLRRKEITFFDVTPSVLAVTPPDGLTALRRVVVGGEACTAAVVESWAPGRRFYNGYGPTEVTVLSTLKRCVPSGRPPSIGRPTANVRAHVLDARLQPLPIGVPGELFLGGLQVARGYGNRPGLTAERFLPDPFAGVPGARMYRTGDVVRLLADGEVEYLGRSDHQVKLRGYRIELGEIEATLARHPAVAEVCVVPREDTPGQQRLVAYCVAEAGQPLEPSALRAWAEQTLPAYMVPSVFVPLPALPLDPIGKVNRRALPAPEQARSTAAARPPTTALERALAELWQELLGVSAVGLEDDFFELGGHSLLAAQVSSRLRQRFGATLGIRALFEAPTLGAFAGRLEAELALQAGPAAAVPEVDVAALGEDQVDALLESLLTEGDVAGEAVEGNDEG